MKPIGHVLRYIEKNYPGISIKEQDDTKAHIFTETESIWICFEDGQIKENKRARRGTKTKEKENVEEVDKNTSSDIPIPLEKPVNTTVEKDATTYTKKPTTNIFHEGDVIESVYTGTRYIVTGIDGNMLRIQDKSNEYGLYLVAAVDYMKIIK